jgi:HEPN domain-containing protein
MKQTAVEWLTKQISSSKYFYKLVEEIESRSTIVQPNGILQQAKEIEKEQIVDAFVECWKENMPEGYECKQSAEYYYNETYGGNNE